MQHLSQKRFQKYAIDTFLDENEGTQQPSIESIESKTSTHTPVTRAGDERSMKAEEQVVDHTLPTKCEVCFTGGYEDQVLLCDGYKCTHEYHMFCLRPIITEVPEGEWLCPLCSQQGNLTCLSSTLQKKSKRGSRQEDSESSNNTETINHNEHDKTVNNIDPEIKAIVTTTASIGMLIKVFSDEDRNFHTGRIIRLTQDPSNGQPIHLIQFQR